VNNEVKNVLFIVNKFSGAGFQAGIDGRIVELCEKQNIECSLEYTGSRGHATEIARHAVAENKFDWVVAVGGDGTVNEVACGLLHSSLPMGILPKGSGNGLARHLGVPLKIEAALQTLFQSDVIAIDTFTLNGRLSLNVSGIGFDGHVANLFGDKKKRGLQGYAKVTLNEFVQFREFEAEVIRNSKSEKRKSFIIAIANSSQYGNNARIAPAASVCDEILHVCFLKKIPPYRVDFVYNFFAGKIGQTTFCEFIETKEMKIIVDTPVAFHVDGEPCGVDQEFNVQILPASLKMLVPKSSLKY
jgi:diacylglycerol kinase (ATP)